MIIDMNSRNYSSSLSFESAGTVGHWADRLYNEIIPWMEELNINVGSSRYSRYYSYIQDFSPEPSKRINPKKILLRDDLGEMFGKANKAISETVQICKVYDQFKTERSDGFIDRLDKCVSGQDFYNGGANDSGRDFLFELFVAAWFHGKGYKIDFDQSTDVMAIKGEMSFFVECKRLKNIKKYRERFSEACKQLSKCNDAGYKFVFIDIYNCISEGIKLYEYENQIDISSKMDTVVNGFKSSVSKETNDIQKKYSGIVDGIVFFSLCVLHMSDLSAQFYEGMKLIVEAGISDERFEKICSALKG